MRRERGRRPDARLLERCTTHSGRLFAAVVSRLPDPVDLAVAARWGASRLAHLGGGGLVALAAATLVTAARISGDVSRRLEVVSVRSVLRNRQHGLTTLLRSFIQRGEINQRVRTAAFERGGRRWE